MPGFSTHYLFGAMTYSKIEHTYIRKTISKNKTVYSLGLQGPDFLFYFLPSYAIHGNNLGSIMHKDRTGLFLYHLIKARNTFIERMDRQIAEAYILGFLGHYTLDTISHPYVYYMTGYDMDPSARYYGGHMQFETEIDRELLDYYKKIKPSEFLQHKTIRLNIRQWRVISSLLNEAIYHTYPEYYSNYTLTKAAVMSMHFGSYLLKDTHGKKKPIIRTLEHLIMGHPYFSGLIPSDNEQYYIDPCNVLKNKWHNPWDTSQESTASFFELFEQAQEEYLDIISLCSRLFQEKNRAYDYRLLQCLRKILGNKNYHSGLPCDN